VGINLKDSAAAIAHTIDRFPDAPVFAWVAKVRMDSVLRELEGMRHGLYELAGRREISRGLSWILNSLGKGDQYLVITTPTLWHPEALGINGGYLTMNRFVAARGVEIRRLFLLCDEDENDPHFDPILQAHARVTRDLSSSDAMLSCALGTGGYYTAVRKIQPLERHRILSSGTPIGLWRKDKHEILISVEFSEREGGHAAAFQEHFINLMQDATSLEDFLAGDGVEQLALPNMTLQPPAIRSLRRTSSR
jgi:hypothetical protein